MGFSDLILFYVVTGVSLRWISASAAVGPSAIVLWCGALVFFYLPLSATVIELSSRHPQEGGLYIWTKKAFGDFPAYMAGWTYWASNLPYFASVFYFAAGNALYIGGARWMGLSASPAYFMIFSLLALALVTGVNIVGLNIGKWLHNLGAVGMWLPALILVVMGLAVWARYGSATDFTPRSFVPGTHLKDVALWASLGFALSGCEAASFMSGEIKDARHTVPRALLSAGVIIALCYIVGAVALLLALPQSQITSLQGIMQGVQQMAARLHWPWLPPVVAVLVTVGNLGAAGGFLAACARIPFVVGVDKMLPPIVGRLHPRWKTPYVALLIQAVLAAAMVLLGQAGASVKGAYDILVSMGIIAVFIPFLLMFAAMIRLQAEPAPPGATLIPGGKPVAIGLACTGLVSTSAAIVLAAVPAEGDPNPGLAVAKVIGLTLVMILAGALIFRIGGGRAVAAQPQLG